MSKPYQEPAAGREEIRHAGGEMDGAGKWTARERIEYFFDPGAFTEIGSHIKHLTASCAAGGEEAAAGVLAGYGRVNGRMVMAAAEDHTRPPGACGGCHCKKLSLAVDMAREMGIPFVGMKDSGAAGPQEDTDIEAHAGLLKSQILASGIIPQLALLMGHCLGNQAFYPVMQDFVFQCRRTGFLGTADPAPVKTKLGAETDLAALCGVQAHAVRSGCTHVVAEDDRDCLDRAKELIAFLPQNNREKPSRVNAGDDPYRMVPELNDLIPENTMVSFDMHKVIRRIVDNGYFFEIMPYFAKNVIIGFARFNGRSTGVAASQPDWMGGVIDCDAADKVARFVRFCDLFNIPLVNIHDTPAFMIGPDEEWKGILRHGAKMLYAYIDATVPKVTVMVRKSFAGAYLGMCCKDTGADLVFAWPESTVTSVGAETAASIIFAREIKNAGNPEEVRSKRIHEYRDLYENPYFAAQRGYVDDVIMPAETRRKICAALDLLEGKTVVRPHRKFSNINL